MARESDGKSKAEQIVFLFFFSSLQNWSSFVTFEINAKIQTSFKFFCFKYYSTLQNLFNFHSLLYSLPLYRIHFIIFSFQHAFVTASISKLDEKKTGTGKILYKKILEDPDLWCGSKIILIEKNSQDPDPF